MNGLALCAGVGGLEKGIERVLPRSRTVCYVEGEAYVASVLASKMEQGLLHEAPIWSNVRSFDGRPWRGKVDWISGGFPCQPFSRAGSRKGEKDPRHLWPDFVRIIGEVRPRLVFLENVPGVVALGGCSIANDLSDLGYRFAWTTVRASQIGAPHHRNRWFCVAHVNGSSESRIPLLPKMEFFQKPDGSFDPDPYGDGCRFPWKNENHGEGIDSERWVSRSRSSDVCSDVPNTHDSRRPQQWRTLTNEQKQTEPQFKNWWSIEPGVGRMVDGMAYRIDRLRACGNGVVPQQAEAAYRYLIECLNASA